MHLHVGRRQCSAFGRRQQQLDGYTDAMADNTVERHAGRLIEFRHAKGFQTVADIEQMSAVARSVMESVRRGKNCVIVADWRSCSVVMSPVVSQCLLDTLLAFNPHTERGAMLYAEGSATAIMQFVRVKGDARNPTRRMFADPLELAIWLEELLTPAESARLREFLGIAAC